MKKSHFIIIFFTLFHAFSINAQVLDEFGLPDNQSIRFKRFDRIDGLVNDNARAIFQDKQGLIWLGTMNGLSRFDGLKFVNFKFDSDEEHSISSNSIRHITSNSDTSLLYISTSKGLNVLDISTNKFDRRFEQDELNTLSNFSCFYSCVDQDKRIWVGTWGDETDGYINIIDKGTVEKIKLDDNGDILCIESIFIDHLNNVWVGTRNAGIYKLDYANCDVIEHYTYDAKYQGSISNNNITSIFEDSKKRLFVLTYKGVNLYNRNTNTFSTLDTKNDSLSINKRSCLSMIEDENDNLWIGTDSGIYVYKPNFEKYRIILPDNKSEFGIKNSFVQKLYKDKYNNIWVCTQLGVFLYNKYANQFGFLDIPVEKTNPTYQLPFSHSRIHEGKDKSIWISLDHKYVNYNPLTRQIKSWSDEEVRTTFPKDIAVCDSKGNCFIRSLYSNGLYYRSKGSKVTEHLMHSASDSSSISDNLLIDIYRDSRDNLWFLSNNNGVSRYIPESHSFKNYTHNDKDPNSLPYNFMYGIKEDLKNNLWFVSWSSLSKYNYKDDNFCNCLVDRFSSMYSIVRDSNIFYIGTPEGLVHYNPETNKIEYLITKQDRLAGNSVHGILKDSIGNLWVSSPKGISKIYNNKSIANFYPADGLQSRDFLHEAFLKASDGTMYFGGIEGVNYFNPYDIKVNPVKADVIISAVELNNKPIHFDPRFNDLPVANLIKEIDIDYKDNILRFEFSAVHYSYSKGCSYRYKMEGFDKEWIQIKQNPSATYTNLHPGTYEFKVMASNNHFIWNPKYTSIIVNVKPPFWLTLWFKVLSICVLLFLIYMGYYLKLYLLNKKRQELEITVLSRTKELKDRQKIIEDQSAELITYSENLKSANKKLEVSNASKDKFFSIIAHDLRSPLALLIGFTDLMVNALEKDDYSKKEILNYSQVINGTTKNTFDLLNNLLEWSRAQIGTIPFKPDTYFFEPLITEMQELFEEQCNNKKIHFSLNYDSNLKLYCDENMMKTILRNLISNAIKFTPENGHISVDTRKSNNFIEISISDTGVGISNEIQEKLFCAETNTSTMGTNNEEGSGLGLILCKEFVIKQQGDIWIESELGIGSKFIFTIPDSLKTYNKLNKENNAKPSHI